jgi:hypothetical protein
MEVRIGVASHALLQTNLKNKGSGNSHKSKRNAQPDYDSEEGF